MTEKRSHEEFVKYGREACNSSWGTETNRAAFVLPEALDRIELLLLENLRLRNLMSVHLPSEIVVLKNPEANAPGEPVPGSIEDLRSRCVDRPKSVTDKASGGE